MSAPPFRYRRVVDLSRPLVPGGEQHPWVRYEARVESISQDQGWYVVSQLQLSGHAGTHVEAPLHALEQGADVGRVPVEVFFGEAVVLDLSDLSQVPAGPFGRECLEQAARQAGGVRAGDIAFLRFDWDRRAGAGQYPPYPQTAALGWLVDQGIKLLGIDSPGLEVQGDRGLPNHRLLFSRGIPLIESLAHLEQCASRVYVFAQPLSALGADAVPLRVLAFEGYE